MKRAIGTLLLAVSLLALVSCAKREKSPMATGQVVTNYQLVSETGPAITADTAYAVVRHDSLPDIYASFRKEIFDKGVTKWDERFDCNHFASYYVALAQTRYYLDNWGSGSSAQTLAMGVLFYRKGGNGGGHAIVEAKTDKGVVDIEPQTGQVFVLTEAERQSVFLRLF